MTLNFLLGFKKGLYKAVNKVLDEEAIYGSSKSFTNLRDIYLTYWYFNIIKDKLSKNEDVSGYLDKTFINCLACRDINISGFLKVFGISLVNNPDGSIGIEFTYIVEGVSSPPAPVEEHVTLSLLQNGCVNNITNGTTTNDGGGVVVIPLPNTMYKIYFGESVNAIIDDIELNTMSYLLTNTLAVTHPYVAVPLNYKYLAIDNNLGTANSVVDSNGFNVALITQGAVVLNGATYTVYRTTNIINGTLTITIS